MNQLIGIIQIGIYAMLAVSLVAAAAAVSLPNIFHAALAFVVTLVGVAGVFVALGADFLAVVQVLLYVGAVVTLIVFSLMLTERSVDKPARHKNDLALPAFGIAALLFAALLHVFRNTPWPVREENLAAPVTAYELGIGLLGRYALPFEIISIFLTAVLIGALVIARKDKA
jgi:NADH:ubiquinone oxidoreductase subunit 6 (subunit J)